VSEQTAEGTPLPLYTEVARQRAAQAAMAQDQAHTAKRRSEARADVGDLNTELVDRRNWALQEARNNIGATRSGGPGQLVAWVNPDGSTNIRSDPKRPGKTIATTVHGPPVTIGPCERLTAEDDEAWERQRRQAENTLLAGHFDVAELVTAGLLTEAEATHPGVQAAAADRAARIAGREAPYELLNSVR